MHAAEKPRKNYSAAAESAVFVGLPEFLLFFLGGAHLAYSLFSLAKSKQFDWSKEP